MVKVKISKRSVEDLFKGAIHDAEIIVGIHKLVYGEEEWKRIEKLDGYCVCNRKTSEAIFKMFAEKNKKDKVSYLPGGYWFNYGFSVSGGDGLADWEVIPAPVKYES